MRHAVDPQQNWLFDPSAGIYSNLALRRLLKDWPGVFRTCILEMMPVDQLGGHFHALEGRPTKELYSACGLLLLQEFNNWTTEEAADRYMFDARVQFALNLGRENQSMSTRTLERYRAIFRDEAFAQDLMKKVTARLIELLDLKIDKLRLDSTHVFSNMASFGRTRLMMTVTRRFLVQLKRHNRASYDSLAEDLRMRYESKSWDFSKGAQSHANREQVAADMQYLIACYEQDDSINTRTSFTDMVRVFGEQCEIVEDKLRLRKKTGARAMQNPSDPDATFDGKKGPGYKVQTAETCSDENDTQLIISAIPQTAAESDQHAVSAVVKELKNQSIEPQQVVADAGYGSDRNHTYCKNEGINLIAPVLQGTQKEGRLDLCHFQLQENNRIQACPAGHAPIKAWFDVGAERGGCTFDGSLCRSCEKRDLCLARSNGKNYALYYDGRTIRIAARKLQMHEPETAAAYAQRSGTEALYSIAKRVMGLGRLRVRGQAAVFHAIMIKLMGVNIMRASRNRKILEKVLEKCPAYAKCIAGELCRALSESIQAAISCVGKIMAIQFAVCTLDQIAPTININLRKHFCR